jgi:hypothetical protein
MKNTPQKEVMQRIIDEATPEQLIRMAKLVRAAYVADIANTKEVLDPARLRSLDANIARLEAQVH